MRAASAALSALVTALLLVLASCAPRDRPPPSEAQAPEQSPSQPAPSTPAGSEHNATAAAPPEAASQQAATAEDILGGARFVGSPHRFDWLTRQLANAGVQRFRPVGHSSTVFHVELEGPIDAAFKARTHDRPGAPAAEVAAYRLARLLTLTNVPPAVLRSIPAHRLRRRLRAEDGDDWTRIAQRLQIEGGQVRGAAIYWVPGLTELGVDRPAGMRRWSEWLRIDGDLPEEDETLAASVSAMLVFDYLIGNWDRFSGGNAKGRADGRHLYFRDHDVAFPRRIPPRMHRKLLDRVLQVQRFSRRLLARVQALKRDDFESALAREPSVELSGRAIAQVFDRQRTILSHIGALIEQHGADRVLFFP